MLPFGFESTNGKQIWCFARNENYIYSGTGPDGKILRSTDYYNWSDFQTVDDSHVKSLYIWANGLFIGTQPHGKIYVYNFTSDKFYHFVQTEDSCVTCFMEYKGYLYAGTSPMGSIYKFDKNKWERLHRVLGNGVSSMSVYNNVLYVFANNAEAGLTYDGSDWKIMKIKNITVQYDQDSSSESSSSSEQSSQSEISETPVTTIGEQSKESFASFKNSQYEPLLNSKNKFLDRSKFTVIEEEIEEGKIKSEDANVIEPQIDIKSILSSCVDASKIYMGSDNGVIFEYPDAQKNANILHQLEDGNVNQIINIGDNTLIAAIDNKLYLIKP